MSKWLFKTRLHWLYFWWPLKACSETASSFISIYVIGALFAFPLFCSLRPSAKLEDVFTAALGWLKRASAWGQRKQCSCLRLFCAVTAPWQQRVIPRRRWRKGRKPGNEAALNVWLWGGIVALEELHQVWSHEISMHKMIAVHVKKWKILKPILQKWEKIGYLAKYWLNKSRLSIFHDKLKWLMYKLKNAWRLFYESLN